MSKFLAIAALVGTTAIAGCTQGINPTDTDRALIGAGVGATIASVSGENVVKGAAIGGAAGALCNDVRLCQ
ncbi:MULTISPECIES: YMGG-like glycine zipper-containing protein [Paracoccus]|jgi:osmotically inducible lipoprotein OsmB|uniref:YMGG-like glycine zipper-containing protein n=1 Tax=Paracoccus TaxID=265 RepID=UPI001F288B9D|nr:MULTISPECIES: YMGG-like glycine zipper-containing protein [Paracoccus]